LTYLSSRKENIYDAINEFNLLTDKSKRQMKDYLDGFFDVIKNPSR
jgi:hypothetical protein